ncbi:hypothetical protein BXZ70DRAFT_911725 [Cristinia sonorae]|uniref:Uncharacterized protein n=1 Tax=Cristinia sonorae TaxID=1940300 RepID=A0A8K0UEM2_9AGAR|nr:hypothetical protein BXZ70DRAFT_911725 [Cristinia sonorae]
MAPNVPYVLGAFTQAVDIAIESAQDSDTLCAEVQDLLDYMSLVISDLNQITPPLVFPPRVSAVMEWATLPATARSGEALVGLLHSSGAVTVNLATRDTSSLHSGSVQDDAMDLDPLPPPGPSVSPPPSIPSHSSSTVQRAPLPSALPSRPPRDLCLRKMFRWSYSTGDANNCGIGSVRLTRSTKTSDTQSAQFSSSGKVPPESLNLWVQIPDTSYYSGFRVGTARSEMCQTSASTEAPNISAYPSPVLPFPVIAIPPPLAAQQSPSSAVAYPDPLSPAQGPLTSDSEDIESESSDTKKHPDFEMYEHQRVVHLSMLQAARDDLRSSPPLDPNHPIILKLRKLINEHRDLLRRCKRAAQQHD